MSSMKSRKKIENISILANNKQTNNNKNLITENRKYQKTLITENCDWWCQWLAGLFCFFRYFLVINKYHFSISIINWSSKKCCPFINNVFVCCNVWPPFFQKKNHFELIPHHHHHQQHLTLSHYSSRSLLHLTQWKKERKKNEFSLIYCNYY